MRTRIRSTPHTTAGSGSASAESRPAVREPRDASSLPLRAPPLHRVLPIRSSTVEPDRCAHFERPLAADKLEVQCGNAVLIGAPGANNRRRRDVALLGNDPEEGAGGCPECRVTRSAVPADVLRDRYLVGDDDPFFVDGL